MGVLGIRPPRAIGSFLLAWVAMDVVGTASYLLISLLMTGAIPGAPAGEAIVLDPVWQVSNRVLPLLNLPVWVAGGWWYFRRPRTSRLAGEAWLVGALWLAMALPLDLLHYVLIPTPLTIGASAFYVAQFPWIYLVYAIVLIAPRLALALRRSHVAPPHRTDA